MRIKSPNNNEDEKKTRLWPLWKLRDGFTTWM